MKHMVINLLALALLLVFLPITTLAAPGDATLLLEGGEIEVHIEQSVAVVGDTLYIFRPDEKLYSYHVGDEAPAMLMDLKRHDAEKSDTDDLSLRLKSYQSMSAPGYSQAAVEASADDDQPAWEFTQLQYIVGGGDKLYALERSCERLWAFNDGKGVFEPVIDLDASAIKSGLEDLQLIYELFIFNHRIIDGSLYMLVSNYDRYMTALKKLDLSTGAVTTVYIDKIFDYAPYKEGKLLVGLGERETKEIGVFDPKTGKYEKKMDIPAYGYDGLQYNGDIDALYMWCSGEILRSVAFGALETVAYTPFISYNIFLPCALLPGGYYVLCIQDCVQVRNTDPQYMPERQLKLHGVQYEEMTRFFTKANPDVPITYSDAYFMNMEEMAAHMASPDAADVYSIYSNHINLSDLYINGCLADLSTNQAIAKVVDKMYPNIRKSLTFDGKITAIPYTMYISTFGVNLMTLEEIGLTLDDAPKTYYALLEFIERWINEYSIDYPDLKLFEYSDGLDYQLIYPILSAQITYCDSQNEPLTFDTPVMRKLLAKLESIDFTPLSENVSSEDEGDSLCLGVVACDFDSNRGNAPLFNFHNTITCNRYETMILTGIGIGIGGSIGNASYMNWEFEPTPLALDEGMPAILEAQVSWMVLNQKSTDYEEAMRFMQYFAENMYPSMRINTMPDENEPIKNPYPYYTQDIKDYQEQLDILETLLEMADEGTKQFIEKDIQRFKRTLENEEKQRWRWAVTPEFIARYRSLYDHVSISQANPLFIKHYDNFNNRNNDEFFILIDRYIGKQINSNQLIIELNRMLRMTQMEEEAAVEIPGFNESKGIMNGSGTMLATFSGLSDFVKKAIITGLLAMITGLVVAIINKEKKKKAKEQPPSSYVTVTQQDSIYNGKGAGAVAGGNQDFLENKNEKG